METPKQKCQSKLVPQCLKDITPIYCILVIQSKEADNPINKIMCQDILINVIFGCESELWRLRFGVN